MFNLQVRDNFCLFLAIIALNISIRLKWACFNILLLIVSNNWRVAWWKQLINLHRGPVVWRCQFFRKQIVLIRRWGNLLTAAVHIGFLLLLLSGLILVIGIKCRLCLICKDYISSGWRVWSLVVERSVYLVKLLIHWRVSSNVILTTVLKISSIWYLASFKILGVFTATSWIVSTFLTYINFIQCLSI